MKKQRKPQTPREDYSYERLHEEREFGFFWYSWLWSLLRPVLIIICALLVLAGVFSAAWHYISTRYVDPVDVTASQTASFEVKSGSSLSRVAADLEAAGLIRNRSVFKYYADFLGYGQKIQAGTYSLSPAMTLQAIAEMLTAGDGTPLVRTITLIEGWTAEDIAAYLVRQGALANGEEFLSLCRTGDAFTAYYYIADVKSNPNASQRVYALEGYLSPNTYELYTSATAQDIIKKLLSQTEAVYKEAWHARTEELGMTMDQVITLASMIEKEAKQGDFKKVSAIFHNRLKLNMALGSDVTVKYVTGTSRMSLTSGDLSVNSPYNTYQHTGLPPGPICSPSGAAIEAALYPDEDFTRDQYLYFCSKDPGTGELYFSRTLAEHEAAVSIYAPLWQAYDEKTGAQ